VRKAARGHVHCRLASTQDKGDQPTFHVLRWLRPDCWSIARLTVQNMQFDGQHVGPGKRYLKFNIQFPVAKERYIPRKQVFANTSKGFETNQR
jgi:hypothetical protein